MENMSFHGELYMTSLFSPGLNTAISPRDSNRAPTVQNDTRAVSGPSDRQHLEMAGLPATRLLVSYNKLLKLEYTPCISQYLIPGQSRNMTTETNKACLLYGPGDARFEEIPVPSLESNPRDVLVRIAYTGVCGSDVSSFRSHDPVDAGLCRSLLTSLGSFLGARGHKRDGPSWTPGHTGP